MNDITLQVVSGENIHHYLDDLARLRMEIFRDYPYLYEGSMAYERNYLQTYIQAPNSLMVVALTGDDVIGVSTAVPLRYETENVLAPFIARGIDVNQVFYLGESVLRRAYRGRGLGVRFFAERERFARELGGMKYAAFCGVDRPADHPQRPADYEPLDAFWSRRGYHRQFGMHAWFSWRSVGEAQESTKQMNFWLKEL